MICQARNHYLVSDGPASLGCPGEATMPGELFLGLAECAVELVEVFSRNEGLPLERASVEARGRHRARRPAPR